MSLHSAMAANDLLQLHNGVDKSGFLSQKKCFLTMSRWNRKYVILSKGTIFVYDSQDSKTPDDVIPLFGFNAVKRAASQQGLWAFSICPAVKSLKVQTFACSIEVARLEWMKLVRNAIYRANEIEKPQLSVMECFLDTVGGDLESEYCAIEKSVYDVTKRHVCPKATTTDDVDGHRKDIYVSGNITRRRTVSESRKPHTKEKNIFASSSRRQRERSESLANVPPPRYSSVVEETPSYLPANDCTCDDKEPSKNVCLEKACTIVDPSLQTDRDKVNLLLVSKKNLGTYAIRRSRTENCKVLAVSTKQEKVMEYRIQGGPGRYWLHDTDGEFVSIEALLRYFCYVCAMPKVGHHLSYGVYEDKDSDSSVEIQNV